MQGSRGNTWVRKRAKQLIKEQGLTCEQAGKRLGIASSTAWEYAKQLTLSERLSELGLGAEELLQKIEILEEMIPRTRLKEAENLLLEA